MGALLPRIAGVLLPALIASGAPPHVSPFDRIEQLKHEPVDAIRLAFQREDPRLYWTQVYEKLPVDEELSIMLVEAAPLSDFRRSGYLNPDRTQSRFGLFAVEGPGNQVQHTLGIFRPPFEYPVPVVEPPDRERVYIHWLGNYGAYVSTTRYSYRAGSRQKAQRSDYGRFAFEFVAADGPRLYYRAAYSQHAPSPHRTQNAGVIFDTETREFTITATPPAPAQPQWRLPETMRWNLPDGVSLDEAARWSTHFQNGVSTLVTEKGLYVYNGRGQRRFYTHPPTSKERLEAARPDLHRVSPAGPSVFQPNANFGPVAQRGGTLWFASTFYDGEGMSGVGAIGRIAPGERTVEMRYPPEMACCSGSALFVEPEGEEVLYVGLVSRPEGAPVGRGLLRYNPATGAAQHYPIPDVISDIRRAGEALAVATAHGLYLFENGAFAHYRLEPAREGGLELVTFALPHHP